MASSREYLDFLAWRQQQQQRQPSYPLHQQQLAVGQLTAELNDRSYITWSKSNENGPMDTLRKNPYKCCPHCRRPYSPTDTHFEGSSSISQCHCHRCLNNLDPNLHFPSFDGRLAQPSMQQPQPIHLVLQDRHRPPAGNTDTLSSNNIVDPFLEFLEATNLEDRNANDVQNSPLVPSAFPHATTPSLLSDPVREATSALPIPLAPPAQLLAQSPRCLNTPGTSVLLSERIPPLRPIPQVPTGSPLDMSSPTSQNEPTYIPALTLLSSVPLNQSVNMTPVAAPIEGGLNTVAIEESENVSMAAITRKKIKSLWKQFRCERLADKVMS
ncbi:hypothetical protein AN958_07743 [Leucoagaricus sp. SymC.cos]|nr:hypothetical protein AN958_07743 [Leucoagaricus sp. SymC.cos]